MKKSKAPTLPDGWIEWPGPPVTFQSDPLPPGKGDPVGRPPFFSQRGKTQSPAQHAVHVLREAADALDELPAVLRRIGIMGPLVVAQQLRNEADHIEDVVRSVTEAAK